MATLWLAIPAVLLLFAFSAKPGIRNWIFAAVLIVALVVFPTGSSRSEGSLRPWMVVVLIIGGFAFLHLRKRYFPASFLPFLAFVGLMSVLGWSGGVGFSGNIFVILLAICAWVAGGYLADATGHDPNLNRALSIMLLGVLVFEAAICALQFVGIGLFELQGRTLELEGGRSNGTYTHPSVIGKNVLLLLLILLPMTRSNDRITRRMANLSLLVALVPVGLSESRANFVGLIAAYVVWTLIQPRTDGFKKMAILAGMSVVALFFVNLILERFENDPLGGARQHFTEVALQQLVRNPWLGVGPGQYVPVVGTFDRLTSEGWPVHNVYLLLAVELGLVGAILLLAPIAILGWKSLRRIRQGGPAGDAARALIAIAPGFVLISVTGWGLLASSMMALWFLAFGYVARQVSSPTEESEGDGGNLAVENRPHNGRVSYGNPRGTSSGLSGPSRITRL